METQKDYETRVVNFYTQIDIPLEEYSEWEQLSITRNLPSQNDMITFFKQNSDSLYGDIELELSKISNTNSRLLLIEMLQASSKMELSKNINDQALINAIVQVLSGGIGISNNHIAIAQNIMNSVKGSKLKPVLYEKLKERINGTIRNVLKSNHQTISPQNLELLTQIIIKSAFKMNFNAQEYEKKITEKARTTYFEQNTNAQTSVSNTKSCQDIIVKNLVEELTYISAKKNIEIQYQKGRKTFYVNGNIYPISILKIVLEELKNRLLPNAINNCNMFLLNSERIFYDQLKRKHQLYIDDSHILGIKQTSDFIKHMIDNSEEFKRYAQEYLDREREKQGISPNAPLKMPSLQLDKLSKKLINIQLRGIISKVQKLDENSNDIDEQIRIANSIQTEITKIMVDRRDSAQMELLVYKIIVHYMSKNNTRDSKKLTPKVAINEISTKNPEELQAYIKEVLDNNNYYFDKMFIEKIKKNENLFLELQKRFNNKNKVAKLYEKYQTIEKIQEILNCFYKVISARVLIERDKTIQIVDGKKSRSWESYFRNKHQNGIVQNDTIGAFGVAQIFIENEIGKLQNLLNNTQTDTSFYEGLNVFKILDKILYLNNFNYTTDITQIYVTDNQNGKKIGLMCEMNAFYELLLAYFSKINELKTAEFYSVQNVEELTISTNTMSTIPNLVDFEQKEYSTIIALEFVNTQNIITQNHNEVKKAGISEEEFIKKLRNRTINLRYATSLSIKSDQVNNVFDFLQLYQRKSNSTEIWSDGQTTIINLIGCSNILNWLKSLNYNDESSRLEFDKFCGIKTTSEYNFNIIKGTLLTRTLEYIGKLIDIKIRIYEQRIDEIEEEKKDYLKFEWGMVHNHSKTENLEQLEKQKREIQEIKKHLEECKKEYLRCAYQCERIICEDNIFINPSRLNQENSPEQRQYISNCLREELQRIPECIQYLNLENLSKKINSGEIREEEKMLYQQMFLETIFQLNRKKHLNARKKTNDEVLKILHERHDKSITKQSFKSLFQTQNLISNISLLANNFREEEIIPLLEQIDKLNITKQEKARMKIELAKKLYKLPTEQFEFIDYFAIVEFNVEVMKDIRRCFELEKSVLADICNGGHLGIRFCYEHEKSVFYRGIKENLNMILDYFNSLQPNDLIYGTKEEIITVFLEDILLILEEYPDIYPYHSKEELTSFITQELIQDSPQKISK